jgi:hypothetical protein
MFHYYSYNTEQFMEHYHKRSNVETTFSMIKAKFGNHLRSKAKPAQINEALCKVLYHNICCPFNLFSSLGLSRLFGLRVRISALNSFSLFLLLYNPRPSKPLTHG